VRILRQRSALSCSFSAMMPVCDRFRAMRPNCFAPCARYLSASSDKTGGEDGTFNRLNGAYGQMLVEIEIDGADAGLRGGELFRDFRWGSERLFNGGVQPPLSPLANERRTSHLKTSGQCT
jgi:hypothetical protein